MDAIAGSAESLQLGFCGFSLWHFSVGTLIAKELSNIKNRRVAKAATLRYLLCWCAPLGQRPLSPLGPARTDKEIGKKRTPAS
jgi:hypothetical protein